MKKNISINISGIIFHIEEDGYERLKNYLESINRYFTALDDSGEIVQDIESRIAEIFLAKLKEGQQVISSEDVDELIATMGSVEDFEAEGIEEEELAEEEKAFSKKPPYTRTTVGEGVRKFYRDMKRRLLGGVCAGIAHYFGIDPMWIRLVFIALFFDVFFSSTIGSVTLVTYIILWIVVPPSHELEEDTKIKKMYREPDNRVLGGIASGIGAYFGVDANVIRLIFVLFTIFGGTGLIVYLILWIITPEARTLTDRMEMQGEPVTLSNIESNIKRSLNVKEGEESPLLKVLLFPFRLIALIIETLGRLLGPMLRFLGEFIRIVFGAALSLAGLAIIVTMITLLFVGVEGVPVPDDLDVVIQGIPLEVLHNTIPTMSFVSGFFAFALPALAMVLLGLAIILNKMLLNSKIAWSLFAVWLIGCFTFAFSFFPVANNFRTEGTHKVKKEFALNGKTAVLQLNYTGMDEYEAASLRIRGHRDSTFLLEERFRAHGANYGEALENAQSIIYHVSQQDSVITFDSNIQFGEGSPFRAQELNMTLYVPYYQPFIMKEDLAMILRSTLSRYNVRRSEMERNTWIFTESGLECLNCSDYNDDQYYSKIDSNGYEEVDIYELPADFAALDNQQELSYRDFQALEVEDFIQVNIQQGNRYEVIASGERRWVDRLEIEKRGKKLVLSVDHPGREPEGRDHPVRVNIIMPNLEDLELKEKSLAIVRGFDEEDMHLSLRGESYADVAANNREMVVDMRGNSQLILKGKGKYFLGDIDGNSQVKAFGYTTKIADWELGGNANAQLHVLNRLTVENENNSSVRYRGNPRLDLEGNSGAVRRE